MLAPEVKAAISKHVYSEVSPIGVSGTFFSEYLQGCTARLESYSQGELHITQWLFHSITNKPRRLRI